MRNDCNIKVYLKTLMLGGINRDSFQKNVRLSSFFLSIDSTNIYIFMCVSVYLCKDMSWPLKCVSLVSKKLSVTHLLTLMFFQTCMHFLSEEHQTNI